MKEDKRNVSKVIFLSYTNKTYQHRDNLKPFTLPVNPESYQQQYKIEIDKKRGHGSQKTGPRFKSTAPEELKLSFIFDGTGTIQGYYYPDGNKKKDVQTQLEVFKKMVYKMNGNIHRPRFLKIFWGDLVFQGILTDLTINYLLFNKEGKPLRAKLDTTFIDYVAQQERVKREKSSSPDLTHTRLVKEGKRLDLMSFDIYKDPNFLGQIAKANNLTSIRNIKVGQTLFFPPFDKKEV